MIQWSGRSGPAQPERRSSALTVLLALTASLCMSLFDVLLQKWGMRWDSFDFLPVMFISAIVFSFGFLPCIDSPQGLKKLKVRRWIAAGTALMAVQALSMTFALSQFGDAPRINIIYSLRGLWGVVLAWMFAAQLGSGEAHMDAATMTRRLVGAVLLTIAVLWVILH